MIPNMKDDDIWMPHPVNYTPWFKWLNNRRQESFERRLRVMKKRLRDYNQRTRNRDLCLDIYLVEYSKEDGVVKSNYQRQKEGQTNRVFEEIYKGFWG